MKNEMLLHDYIKEAARVAVKLGLSKEAYLAMAGTLFDTCQKRKQEKQELKKEKEASLEQYKKERKKNDDKEM